LQHPTDRRTTIAGIIGQRTPFLQEIQSRQQHLQLQLAALKRLEAVYETIRVQGPAGMFALIEPLAIPELVERAEILARELAKPIHRFGRQTLNIGVIGRTGQGKSTLLQRLSGVGEGVIPSGHLGFCTGVRSIVLHSSDPQKKGGVISFYERDEFLRDVLAPYYPRLGLGPAPGSLEDFIRAALPPLPPAGQGDATLQAMYGYLVRYKTRINAYKDFLSTGDLPVDINDVRTYITQESEDGKQTYSTFLAVKEARITSNFHHKDVEQIALVDMPGQGEMNVGDDQRLMQALGKQIDVALFVILPHTRAELHDHDYHLYQLARSALQSVPLELWSFLVLNRRSADTKQQGLCQKIKDEKVETIDPSGTTRSPLKVARCLIANCSETDEAGKNILEPVLDYLTANMQHIDEIYMKDWRTRLSDLDQAITRTLEQAGTILDEKAAEMKDHSEFERCFRDLWDELTAASFELIRDLTTASQQPDEQFAREMQAILTTCRQDHGLPTLDEIRKRIGSAGAPINAFNDFLHEIRTHLTHHFLSIDQHTNFPLNEVKKQIAQFFLVSGQLRSFLPTLANEAGLFQALAENLRLSEKLRETCRIFGTYQLSFRGLFLSRIRGESYLDDIIPFYGMRRVPGGISPQDILSTLESLQQEAVNAIACGLSNFHMLPSRAAGALGMEFVDQVLRSKDVRNDWHSFYLAHRLTLWPEVFSQSELWGTLQQEWRQQVRQVRDIHQHYPI
jgi:energy-coupling factor transporter ATP-binding protein EcfA2